MTKDSKPTRSELIKTRLFECIHNGELENIQLLEIFKHTGDILGICTPKQYAEYHKISVQAAHNKNSESIFGIKLIIDND